MNLERYVNLIPPAHRWSRENGQDDSRFARFVRMILRQGVDLGNLLESFESGFDIDKAVGSQLDVLGAILNVDRKLPFAVADELSSVMTDEEYRVVLKGAVAKSMFWGTVESLKECLAFAFPTDGIRFTDNQDLTVTIQAPFEGVLEQAMYNDMLIPRPAGVQYYFQKVSRNLGYCNVLAGVSDVRIVDQVNWMEPMTYESLARVNSLAGVSDVALKDYVTWRE